MGLEEQFHLAKSLGLRSSSCPAFRPVRHLIFYTDSKVGVCSKSAMGLGITSARSQMHRTLQRYGRLLTWIPARQIYELSYHKACFMHKWTRGFGHHGSAILTNELLLTNA